MSAPEALIAGRYRVRSRVGTGGMGVVWEGWDERLHRTVAIKQLHPQPGLSAVEADIANQRAMREARITARLHHPYAVSVFDVVEHEGQPCLVMQFVPSKPLSAVLRERGPLPPEGAARMGAQISSALAAAHRVGIVHRDVKPGNVLISDDGTARISDFGISHALGDVTLTTTGMVTGTPAFLAPEVARGGEAGFASDVFSLGATLYAAVEGAPPFGAGQNSMALLHKVALGEVVPPSRTGALTPLLMRMLATDPDDRPSMAEVAQSLAAYNAVDPGPNAATALLTPTSTDQATPWPPSEQSRRPSRAAPLAADPPTARSQPTDSTPTAAVPAASSSWEPAPWAPDDVPGERSDDDSAPPSRGRRRLLWAAMAVALLIAAATLATALIPGGTLSFQPQTNPPQAPVQTPSSSDSTGDPSAPTSTATSASASVSSPPASSPPASSPAPSRVTRSPSPSPSPTARTSAPSSAPPTASNRPTARQLARAISGYYGLVPDDTDAAWARMTDSYRRNTAGGRESYENFWDEIDRVTVSRVAGNPPDQAVATVTYYYDDGRVVDERTEYGLVNDGGVLKINSSRVVSSSTR